MGETVGTHNDELKSQRLYRGLNYLAKDQVRMLPLIRALVPDGRYVDACLVKSATGAMGWEIAGAAAVPDGPVPLVVIGGD